MAIVRLPYLEWGHLDLPLSVHLTMLKQLLVQEQHTMVNCIHCVCLLIKLIYINILTITGIQEDSETDIDEQSDSDDEDEMPHFTKSTMDNFMQKVL